mmetsp:Transcript_14953/g.31643  ORF Transcript_14953/g.31643 Transcript_14953/m.31643 type:complete len:97 (-) Transcript_14953:4-294(-)
MLRVGGINCILPRDVATLSNAMVFAARRECPNGSDEDAPARKQLWTFGWAQHGEYARTSRQKNIASGMLRSDTTIIVGILCRRPIRKRNTDIAAAI